MTFRRLKKVNSSGPDSGPASPDNDIYFSSSKSDSCRTMHLPTNSSEVYNYKTLAYSGGTLPRKKVGSALNLYVEWLYWCVLIHWDILPSNPGNYRGFNFSFSVHVGSADLNIIHSGGSTDIWYIFAFSGSGKLIYASKWTVFINMFIKYLWLPTAVISSGGVLCFSWMCVI